MTTAGRRLDPAAPTHSNGYQKPATRRWWPMMTVVALLAVGASLLSPYGRHQWALSLFRQPTPYTVLSFNQPAALPATTVVHEPVRISFTVANHEGHAVDYRYVLSSAGLLSAGSRGASAGGTRILRSSARMVSDGATWTVSTTVRPTCGISLCRLEVSLPGHPETIDFLVTLTAAGRRAPKPVH